MLMTKNKFINLCLKPRPNTPEMTLETVLVFGLELVSYERSRRAKQTKMQHFSARVFFEIISTQFLCPYMDIEVQ